MRGKTRMERRNGGGKREDKVKIIGGESGQQDDEMRKGEERGNWQRKEISSEKTTERQKKERDNGGWIKRLFRMRRSQLWAGCWARSGDGKRKLAEEVETETSNERRWSEAEDWTVSIYSSTRNPCELSPLLILERVIPSQTGASSCACIV